MIPSGVKVFLASHPIDFRKGPDSLLSLVRDAGSSPFNGALYVFGRKEQTGSRLSGVMAQAFAFMQSGWKKLNLLAARWSQPSPAQQCPASGFGMEWIGNAFDQHRSNHARL
jgi:hypothetical protein